MFSNDQSSTRKSGIFWIRRYNRLPHNSVDVTQDSISLSSILQIPDSCAEPKLRPKSMSEPTMDILQCTCVTVHCAILCSRWIWANSGKSFVFYMERPTDQNRRLQDIDHLLFFFHFFCAILYLNQMNMIKNNGQWSITSCTASWVRSGLFSIILTVTQESVTVYSLLETFQKFPWPWEDTTKWMVHQHVLTTSIYIHYRSKVWGSLRQFHVFSENSLLFNSFQLC